MSVQMKSTVPLSTAMIMAGAVSAADWISAPSIWGRQNSYQSVPDWAVAVPVRSLRPWAEARGLSALVTHTKVA